LSPDPVTPGLAEGHRALVLGCGNLLAGDDGVGPEVARRLASAPVPEGVEIVDGGTLGLDLLPLLDNQDVLVLVDAVDTSHVEPAQPPAPPGAISVWEGADVARVFAVPLSVHEVAVADLLGAAALAGRLPRRVVVVGVQPHSTQTGVGLSATVDAAVPQAVETVLGLLASRRL
jgi:hydrogenase maturation protease